MPGPEAEKAVKDLRAKVYTPIHWGAYPMFDSMMTQGELAKLRSKYVPEGRMAWLRPGKSATFMKPGASRASPSP